MEPKLLTLGRMPADKADEELVAVVLDRDDKGAVVRVRQYGTDRIISMERPEYGKHSFDARTYAMVELVRTHGPSAILIDAINNGRDFGLCLFYRLRTGPVADCTSLDYDAESGNVTWTRPAFGGDPTAAIMCSNTCPQTGTVYSDVFRKLPVDQEKVQVIRKNVSVPAEKIRTGLVDSVWEAASGIVNLEDAEVIVSGGRGMGGPENFKLLEELAGILGVTVGTSRAAVNAKWIDHVHRVGQTGKTTGFKLYIVCGISGTIQHLAGISGSDCIVAVNKDSEASAFKTADYNTMGNLFEVLPALTGEIGKLKA